MMTRKEIERLVADIVKKHIGGAISQALPGDTKDASGRRIIDIGKGQPPNINNYTTIQQGVEKPVAPYSAKFDRDRCRIIDSKTIQLQMTPPESTGYERFVISRGRKLVDNDQSEQLEVQEITTGIGNAVPWSASASVTANKTICYPTSPTGKYYRCVTSGTTGTSEPTWSDTGTITDGTAEWELQDNQPVIGNLYITENTGGNPSCGASNGSLRIVKAGRAGSGQDWDYSWGDATGTNKSGRFLLYSESGKPWKQFRIGGDSVNGITARIVDIVWDEWSDGGYNYAVANTIIVSRPLLELPYPIHYMIYTGTIYSYHAPYDVNRYIIQDNGDIYTELVLSASAAARSDNGSFVYKSSSALSLPGVGDTLTFDTKNAYGQDDSIAALNRIAPLKTDKGIAAVVEFYSSKAETYTGTYYACRRYYLYEWGNNPATFATARELRIPGYETDWHGTAAWDNVSSSLEQVVSDGNDYGVLVQLHKTDSSTPLYFRKLFVSENGADFTEQMSDSGTSDPDEKAFCIGFHQDYFNTLTYARVKHLAIAYGDYTGSTVTVNSVTFGGLLYTATLAGAIAGSSGVKLALSYDKPDNANSVADEDNIAYCNILSCGKGMVYYALTPETFLFGPYTFDFSSDLPSGYGTLGFRQDACYLDGNEMFQPYQYGTKNAVMRSVLTIVEDTTIGDYSNSTITYTALQICTDNDFSGGQLMPLVGERGACVAEPSISGTTFDGDTGQRIFVFRYNPGSGSGELGRVDGTVFRYSAEYNLLSDGYVLYGLNSELEKKQLDRISVADLTNIATTGASGGMQLVPTATDGNLAKFVSGQVQDSGIATTDVMLKSDYDTDDNGIVDKAESLEDDSGNTFTISEYQETLFWNGFDLQDSTSHPDMAWDDGTRTLTLSVKSGSSDFYFWVSGNKVTKTASESITIPDVSGSYYIYYDNSGALQYVLDTAIPMAVLYEYALVAIIQWNKTAGVGKAMNELHGIRMSSSTHTYNHLTFGARYGSGLDIEGLSGGSTTYTQTTSGTFWDEDIEHTVPSQSTNEFMYRYGADGVWTYTTADNKVSYNNGGSYDVWNEFDGSTWKLTEGTNSTDYWIVFHVAMPTLTAGKVYKMIGQNAYSSRAKARNAIEAEMATIKSGTLPTPEVLFLRATIVKRNGKLQTLADGSTHLDLRTIKGGSPANSAAAEYAEDVVTDTTDFDGVLSSADTDVQAALDTIDDHTHEWTDLTDTPSSLSAYHIPYVNSGGTALEWSDWVTFEPASRTINLDSSMSASTIQAKIVAAGRFAPPGVTIKFQFADGTYTLNNALNWQGFYGGGTIQILGNASDNSTAAYSSKSVQLDFSGSNVRGINAESCTCNFQIMYLGVKVKTDTSNNAGIRLNYCPMRSLVKYCGVTGTSTSYGYGIQTTGSSNTFMQFCRVGTIKYGYECDYNAFKALWGSDSDTSNLPAYGMNAVVAGTIRKASSPYPTGSTANENSGSGGLIS